MPGSSAPAFARPLVFLLAALMAVGLAVAPPLAAPAAAEPVEAGYRDFDYNNPAQMGVDDVTAARNQSKLWYHDGTWWGLLFQVVSMTNHKFFVFRLDMATQQWIRTDTAVEDRDRANMDVLWDGTSLHVASRHPSDSIHYFRLTYDDATDTWAVVQGPVAIPDTENGTGYTTIAKDGTGRLWIVFTDEVAADDNRVRFTSSADGATWDSPATLPGSTEHIGGDDVAAVTSLTGGIGVLWSEESTSRNGFFFQTHVDGASVNTWQAVETALDLGPGTGDDHVSLKTAPDGRVIAVVKTDMNGPTSPSIVVIERVGDADDVGDWDNHIVAEGGDAATRPVLVVDEGNSQAHVLMTSPVLASAGDQSIYRRSAPLASLDFGTPDRGTAFISSSQDPEINDVTSTKQALGAGWGLVGLAADISTFRYLHGCLGDACTPAPPPPDAPVAAFSASPTSGVAPLAVTFTNTSSNATSWSWNFGDGTTSTEQNPSHTYAAAGTYTVTLTATGTGGTDDEVKTSYIQVSSAPATGAVNRYAGLDRYATAVAISNANFAPNVPVAFVTTGTNFPDALAGAAVAGNLGGPVLLVTPTSIPAAVKAELTRLNPTGVVILGGPGAVSAAVEAELIGMFGAGNVARVQGQDRYATAVAISQTYFNPGVPAAFLATGTNFPDALAGSAAAAVVGGPVLLTTPNALPAAVASELTRLAPAKVYLLGGTGVVSAAIEAQLAAQFGAGNVVRLAGLDRYATAAAISHAFFAVNPAAAFVATGLNFPDALAGAPAAAVTGGGGPVLLVRPTSIPTPIANELTRLKPLSIGILGGTGVVTQGVADALAGYLGP